MVGHRITQHGRLAVDERQDLVYRAPAEQGREAEAAHAQGRFTGKVSFDYRLIAPLFDHQGLVVRAIPEGASITTAVRDVHGRQTAQGTLISIAE